ncbi:hypothetical protein D9M72_558620 [compost metagenome]
MRRWPTGRPGTWLIFPHRRRRPGRPPWTPGSPCRGSRTWWRPACPLRCRRWPCCPSGAECRRCWQRRTGRSRTTTGRNRWPGRAIRRWLWRRTLRGSVRFRGIRRASRAWGFRGPGRLWRRCPCCRTGPPGWISTEAGTSSRPWTCTDRRGRRCGP